MGPICKDDLRKLLHVVKGPCVSIFIAPQAASGVSSGPAEVSSMTTVHALLQQQRVDQSLHQPLLDTLQTQAEWERLAPPASRVLYCSTNLLVQFAVPFALQDRVLVDDHFWFNPLWPLVATGGCFRLLRLNGAQVQMTLCGSETIALASPLDLAAFDDPACDVLPMLLAGPDALCAQWRNVHPEARVLPNTLAVADDAPIQDVEAQARRLVEAHAAEAQKRAVDEYHQFWHTSRVSNQLPAILKAAQQGRVKAIFAATETLSQLRALGDALLATYLEGGAAFCVPQEKVPGRGPAAAIFHY